MSRSMALIDVENRIMRVVDELENETHNYAELSELAAHSEADYRLEAARVSINLSQVTSIKLSVADRSARVDAHTAELYRTWKLADARRHSSREAMLSLRAHLEALRTLAASLRAQT